jgi:hypothetical protein
VEIIVLIVLIVVVWLLISSHNKKKKKEALLKRYGDPEIVERIMLGRFWQGQTQEQLIDSLGRPLDIDERVLKTKTKEIWKYNKTGANRYGLRVILENGVVVGWNQK